MIPAAPEAAARMANSQKLMILFLTPTLLRVHMDGSLHFLSKVAHQSAHLTARARNAAAKTERLQKTNDVSISIGNLAWHRMMQLQSGMLASSDVLQRLPLTESTKQIPSLVPKQVFSQQSFKIEYFFRPISTLPYFRPQYFMEPSDDHRGVDASDYINLFRSLDAH